MSEAGSAPVVAAGGETAGSMLRRAREDAGVHLASLAVSLKVPVRKLEALEEDRYDQLSDAVFLRGLASSVCRTLKIDPQPVLERLPSSTKPRLVHDDEGINAPFRVPGDGPRPAWNDQLTRPAALVVVALLLGAAVLVFLPQLQREHVAAVMGRGNDAASEAPPAPLPNAPSTRADGGPGGGTQSAATGGGAGFASTSTAAVPGSAPPATTSPATSPVAAATPPAPAAPSTAAGTGSSGGASGGSATPSPGATAAGPTGTGSGSTATSAAAAPSAAPSPTAVSAPAAMSAPATTTASPAVAGLSLRSASAPGVSPAASAASPAPNGIVVFRTHGDSWIQVTDARGASVLRKLMVAGDSAAASGALPLTVTVGSVGATDVEVRGKPFNLAPVSRDNVARFEVK